MAIHALVIEILELLYEMLLKADMSMLDRIEFNSLLLGLIIFTILDSSVNNMLISLLTKELLIASLKPLETKK